RGRRGIPPARRRGLPSFASSRGSSSCSEPTAAACTPIALPNRTAFHSFGCPQTFTRGCAHPSLASPRVIRGSPLVALARTREQSSYLQPEVADDARCERMGAVADLGGARVDRDRVLAGARGRSEGTQLLRLLPLQPALLPRGSDRRLHGLGSGRDGAGVRRAVPRVRHQGGLA